MDDNKTKFKHDLKLIEIELFSYCNRVCWFCPNSFVDRRSSNVKMSSSVYFDIIHQLSEIEYDGYITYSRYNEPTAERELFLNRISEARSMLPLAKLKTNTNGDYLTHDYILELRDRGLNELYIQQYDDNKDAWNNEKIRSLMLKKLDKLQFKYSTLKDITGGKIEYELEVPGMVVHLRARNFLLDGSSRGGAVDLAEDYVRTQNCVQPFNNMYIDYNGSVMVCCALRSDVSMHKDGVMGNIKGKKLWDVFYSPLYAPWRAHLGHTGPKEGVCRTCKDGVSPSYEV